MSNDSIFRSSLKNWLQALVIVAVLPVALLSGVTIYTLDQKQEQMLRQNLVQRTNEIARTVDLRINLAIGVLNSMADSEAARTDDYASLYQNAKRLLGHDTAYRAVTLVDASGQIRFHTSIPYGNPTFATQLPELVRRALETGKPNVSGPFVAPISPQSVVAVTIPVFANGQAKYCLRLIMVSESVSLLLNAKDLPAGWLSAIMDSRGTLLARSQSPEKFVGKPAAPAVLAAIQRGDRNPFESVSLEGIKTTTLITPIRGGEWYAAVGVPNSILMEPRYDLLRAIAFAALVWLSIAFALSTALARFLVRQINAVARVVHSRPDDYVPLKVIRITELLSILQGFAKAQKRESSSKLAMQGAISDRDRVQDLYDNAPCGYHSLDPQGYIVEINQTELNWLDRSRDEVMGKPFTDFISASSKTAFEKNYPIFLKDEQIRDVEFELVRRDGSVIPVLVSATMLKDEAGEMLSTRSTVFDITDRKLFEAQLERLARTDALTNLSNRRDFYEQAEREVARSRRFKLPLSLLMMDIDHFKKVNDSYGHAAGDQVLRKFGETCTTLLRATDIPARLGGEEFAVLMPQTPLEQALEVAERLRIALAGVRIAMADGTSIACTVSLGATDMTDQDAHLDTLLQRADAALYQAKHQGRNQVQKFSVRG